MKTQTGEIHSLHVHPNESVDGPIENVVDILSGTILIIYWNPAPSSTGLLQQDATYNYFFKERSSSRGKT